MNTDLKNLIASLAEMFVLNPIYSTDKSNEITGRRFSIEGEEYKGYIHNGAFDTRLAMVFFLDMDVTCGGYENDGNTYHEEWEGRIRRKFVLVITEAKNVFIGHLDEDKIKGMSYDESYPLRWMDEGVLTLNMQYVKWKNTSNHDSCWRSDGLRGLDTVGMDAYHELWDKVPVAHRDRPVDCIDWSLKEGIFGVPFKFAMVQIDRDPERNSNGDSYFKIIKSMQFLDFKMNLLSKPSKGQ